jgi:hypothetical protein
MEDDLAVACWLFLHSKEGVAIGATPFPSLVSPQGFTAAGSGQSTTAVRAVPHRDPFDRLLAAQARSEDLVLASTDPAFTQFEGVVILK